MVVELDEEFLVVYDLVAPGFIVKLLEGFKFFAREIEAGPFHAIVVGHPAKGRCASEGADASAVHDPFEDTHVFAIARPDELSLRILAEPVYVENPRRDAQRALHLDPVPEIIAHVVTAERQHRRRRRQSAAGNDRSGEHTP